MNLKHTIFDHSTKTFFLSCTSENGFEKIDNVHKAVIPGFSTAGYNLLNLGSLDENIINNLKKRKLPFLCAPLAEIEDKFEEFVKSQGLEKDVDIANTYFNDLSKWKYEGLPPEISIEEVKSEEQFKIFCNIAAIAFEDGNEGEDAYAFLKPVLLHKDIHMFLASINGEIAGCGMLSFADNKAGLYWDGVLPEFRKKGIGAELTKFRMNYAKSKGYDSICAHNYPTSLNYYLKIGFKNAGTLPLYTYKPNN